MHYNTQDEPAQAESLTLTSVQSEAGIGVAKQATDDNDIDDIYYDSDHNFPDASEFTGFTDDSHSSLHGTFEREFSVNQDTRRTIINSEGEVAFGKYYYFLFIPKVLT